ncbi:aspartate carbamoyltransferase [Candidatus Woesearchaeota archaeon]|nr:aspartate carbamoyltransferase [Candidatus Woesearchaeota archaeon]
MDLKNRDIISINDFSKEELLHILKVVKQVESNPKNNLLKGKILAALFFEPSTRTRLSFISSMEQLSGTIIGFSTANVTSIQKGESLWDTIKMTGQYADVIVIRHPLEGSARLAAEAASIPVINGGDGSNQHPTQTMLDLYTIQKTKGRLENLHIGFVGDLKYGRTVHSLVIALANFNPTFYFIAPDDLQMPESYLDELFQKKVKYHKTSDLTRFSKELDVLYVTRIQKERFPDPLEYEKFKGIYRIDGAFLQHVKKDLKIMHPLPRIDEIDKSIDNTEHAAYFGQAANGIPVRKALLALVLGKIK